MSIPPKVKSVIWFLLFALGFYNLKFLVSISEPKLGFLLADIYGILFLTFVVWYFFLFKKTKEERRIYNHIFTCLLYLVPIVIYLFYPGTDKWIYFKMLKTLWILSIYYIQLLISP